ncbi:MAG: DUF2058 family protein [Pseudomonadales bacterium]|nr:DUF2058 family protein [Pseudomonadales bacterium]
MSLSDQLKKLGLADAKTVRKAEHAKRQARVQGEDEALRRRVEEQRQVQVEKQRERQAQQAQEREAHERLASARQMILAHAQPRQMGECAYHVVVDHKVRKLWLHPQQHEDLCSGRLRLARVDDELVILLLKDAERVAAKCADLILAPAITALEQTGDPEYDERFKIPDDLMW